MKFRWDSWWHSAPTSNTLGSRIYITRGPITWRLALHHKITSCQQVFLLRRNKNPGGVVHNFSVHESGRPNLGVRWIHNAMSCGKAFVLHFGGNFSPYHAFVRAELEYYESGAKEIGTTLQIHGNGRDFI